jgi:hypothetical protein
MKIMKARVVIDISATPKQAFEWLPCSVGSTCDCERDAFFKPKEDDEASPGSYIEHLRGRLLKGVISKSSIERLLVLAYDLCSGHSLQEGESVQASFKT